MYHVNFFFLKKKFIQQIVYFTVKTMFSDDTECPHLNKNFQRPLSRDLSFFSICRDSVGGI